MSLSFSFALELLCQWTVENSKRLVETADLIGQEESRFDNIRFSCFGKLIAPMLWVIFSSDHQSLVGSAKGKSSWEVICSARSVRPTCFAKVASSGFSADYVAPRLSAK